MARTQKPPAGVEPPYCYVSAQDYARYWTGTLPAPTPAPIVHGLDRRHPGDRRAAGHERRWDASRGRRVRERRHRHRQIALPFPS